MDESFATNTGPPATAGDGAFERFLTAAIAAIITIMFSWRLLATEEGAGGGGEGATGGIDVGPGGPGGQVPKVVMKKAINMAKAAGYMEESEALEQESGLAKEGKTERDTQRFTGVNTVTSPDLDTETLITCWEKTSDSPPAERSMLNGEACDTSVDQGYDGFSRGVPAYSDISIDEGHKPFDPDAKFADDIQPRELDSDEEMYCATMLETIMEEDSDDNISSTSTGSDVDKNFEFGYYDLPPEEEDDDEYDDECSPDEVCTVHVMDDGSVVDREIITISSGSRQWGDDFDVDSNVKIPGDEAYDDTCVDDVLRGATRTAEELADDSNSDGSDESVITVVTRQLSEASDSPVSTREFTFQDSGPSEIVAVRTCQVDQVVPVSPVQSSFQALQPDEAYPSDDQHAPGSIQMSPLRSEGRDEEVQETTDGETFSHDSGIGSLGIEARGKASENDVVGFVDRKERFYVVATSSCDIVKEPNAAGEDISVDCVDRQLNNSSEKISDDRVNVDRQLDAVLDSYEEKPIDSVDVDKNKKIVFDSSEKLSPGGSGDSDRKLDIVFDSTSKPPNYNDAYVSSAVEKTPMGFIFSRFELETTDYEERTYTTERPTHTIIAKLVAEEKFVPTEKADADIREQFAEIEDGIKVPTSLQMFEKAGSAHATDIQSLRTKTEEYKQAVHTRDANGNTFKAGATEQSSIAKRIQSDGQATAPPEKLLRMDKTDGSRSHRIVPVKKELSVSDKLMKLDTSKFQRPVVYDDNLIHSKRLASKGQQESPPEKVIKIGRGKSQETDIEDGLGGGQRGDDLSKNTAADIRSNQMMDIQPTAANSKDADIDEPGAVSINKRLFMETCVDDISIRETTLKTSTKTSGIPVAPVIYKETCIDDPAGSNPVISGRGKTGERKMRDVPDKRTSRETLIDDIPTRSTETVIDTPSGGPEHHAMETAIDSPVVVHNSNAHIARIETNIEGHVSKVSGYPKPDYKPKVIKSRETRIDDPVTYPTHSTGPRPKGNLLKLDVHAKSETNIDDLTENILNVNEECIRRFRDRAQLLREGSGDCVDDSNGNELDASFGDVTDRGEDVLDPGVAEPTGTTTTDSNVDMDESWRVDEVVQEFTIITDADGKTRYVPGRKEHRMIHESHTHKLKSVATTGYSVPATPDKLVEQLERRPTPKPRRSLRSHDQPPSSGGPEESLKSDVVIDSSEQLHSDEIDEAVWRPLSDSEIAEHLPSSMKGFVMEDAIISGSHLVPPPRRQAYSEADKSNPLVFMEDGNLGSYGTRADLLHLSPDIHPEPDIDFVTFAGGVGIADSAAKTSRPLSESSPKHEEVDGNESPDDSGFPDLDVRQQILEQFRRSRSLDQLRIDVLEEEPVFLTSTERSTGQSAFSSQPPESPVVKPTPLLMQPSIPESPVLTPPTSGFPMSKKGSKSVPNLTGIDGSSSTYIPTTSTPGPKESSIKQARAIPEKQPTSKRSSRYTKKPAISTSGPVIKAVAKSKLANQSIETNIDDMVDSSTSHQRSYPATSTKKKIETNIDDVLDSPNPFQVSFMSTSVKKKVETNIDDVLDSPSSFQVSSRSTSVKKKVETNIDDVLDSPSSFQRCPTARISKKEKVETTFTSDVEPSPVVSPQLPAPIVVQASLIAAPSTMHVKNADSGRQSADRLLGVTPSEPSREQDSSMSTQQEMDVSDTPATITMSSLIHSSPTVTLSTTPRGSQQLTDPTLHTVIESPVIAVSPMLQPPVEIDSVKPKQNIEIRSVIQESPTILSSPRIQSSNTTPSSNRVDAPSNHDVLHSQNASRVVRDSHVMPASPSIATSPTILASPSVAVPTSPTILESPSAAMHTSPTILASPSAVIPTSPTIVESPSVVIPISPTIFESPSVVIPTTPAIISSTSVSIPTSPTILASPTMSIPDSPSLGDSSFEDSSFRIQKKYKSMKEIKRKYQPKNFKSMQMPPTPNIGQFVVPPQAVLTARRRINASRKRFLSEENLISENRINDQFAEHKNAIGHSTTKYKSPLRPGQRQPSSYSSHDHLERFSLLYPTFFLDESSDIRPSIDELHKNCILTPEGRRDIMNKTLSIENLTLDLGAHLKRFGSVTSLVETDIDTGETLETIPFPETDLDVWFELQEPIGRAVSMTDLRTDHASQRSGKGRFAQRNVPKSKSLQTLETNLDDEEEEILMRTPSVHELRVTKSLSKLNIPDWFKHANLSKSGSCILRHGSTSTMSSWGFSPSVSSSPCPSVTPSGNVVIKTRVSPSSSMRMSKAPRFSSIPTLPKTPEEGHVPRVLVKLPSDKFRKKEKPKALEKIPIVPFAKIRAMFEAKAANDKPACKPGPVRQDPSKTKAPVKSHVSVPEVTVSPLDSSELVQLESSPKRPRSPLVKPTVSQSQFAPVPPTKVIRPPGIISPNQPFPGSSSPLRSTSPSPGVGSPNGSLSPQKSLSPTGSPRSLSPLGSLNSSFDGSRSFSPSDKMRPINPDGPHNRSFSSTGSHNRSFSPTGSHSNSFSPIADSGARSISLGGNLTPKGVNSSTGTSSPESPPHSPVEKAGPIVKGGPRGIAGPTVRFVETESLEIKDNRPPKNAGKKDFFKRLQMFQKAPEKDKKTKDDPVSKPKVKPVPVSKLKSAFETFTRKDNGNSMSVEATPTLQTPNSKPAPTPPTSQEPSSRYLEETPVIRPPNPTPVAHPAPLLRNVPADVPVDSPVIDIPSSVDETDRITNDCNSHGREAPSRNAEREYPAAPSRVGNSGQSLSTPLLTPTPFAKPADSQAAMRNMKGKKPQYSTPVSITDLNPQHKSFSLGDSDQQTHGLCTTDDLAIDVTDDVMCKHVTVGSASFEEVLEGLLSFGKREVKPNRRPTTFGKYVLSGMEVKECTGYGSRNGGEHSASSVPVACSNPACCEPILVQDGKLYQRCQYCYTYYCSRLCRKSDSDVHKTKCHNSKVANVCRRIIVKVNKDPDLQCRYSQIATAGYQCYGPGCLLLRIPDLYNSERFLHSPLSSKLYPHFVRRGDLSLEVLGPVLSHVTKMCDEYSPLLKYVFCATVGVGCGLQQMSPPVSREPVIQKCANLRLSPVHDLVKAYTSKVILLVASREITQCDPTSVVSSPRDVREASFMRIQRTLRNLGVNLRHEFHDSYNKLIDFVADGRKFPPQVISRVDSISGQPFTCVIMPEVEAEIEWMHTSGLKPDVDPAVDDCVCMSPSSPWTP